MIPADRNFSTFLITQVPWWELFAAYFSGILIAFFVAKIFSKPSRWGITAYILIITTCIIISVIVAISNYNFITTSNPFMRWMYIWISLLPSGVIFLTSSKLEPSKTPVRPPVVNVVWNEKLKLTASFFDRLATTCLTAGVATPLVAYLLDIGEMRLRTSWELMAGCAISWSMLAILCHIGARTILGSLRHD